MVNNKNRIALKNRIFIWKCVVFSTIMKTTI